MDQDTPIHMRLLSTAGGSDLTQGKPAGSTELTFDKGRSMLDELYIEQNETLSNGDRCLPSETGILKTKTRVQDLRGWKIGLIFALTADALMIITTLIVLMTMALHFRRDGTEAVLMEGSCSKAKSSNVWCHLVVNLVSTTLLATSSYAMQLLSSPTKGEVTRAHQKRTCVNIGSPSMWNTLHVQPRRTAMYLLLAFSSIPIHLFANGTVYVIKGTNEYFRFTVSNDFEQIMHPNDRNLSQKIWNTLWFRSHTDPNDTVPEVTNSDLADRFASLLTSMTRLENTECIQQYSDPFMSGYRNLVVVSSWNHNTTGSFYTFNGIYDPWLGDVQLESNEAIAVHVELNGQETYGWYLQDPSTWLCSYTYGIGCNVPHDVCHVQEELAHASNFTICAPVNPVPVAYCLAETVEDDCKVYGNIVLVAIVLACAAVKFLILVTAWRTLPTDSLATIGDAVAFFLEEPEPKTVGFSVLDADQVRQRVKLDPSESRRQPKWLQRHMAEDRWWSDSSEQGYWGRKVPKLLLSSSLLLELGAIAFCGHLLNVATGDSKGFSANMDEFREVGLGNASMLFIFTLSGFTQKSSQLKNLVVVNLPQLYFSIHYFLYNGCWTRMLNAREWAKFGRRHQALRVSQPAGAQRSTYFLAIPYTFAVPLLILSALVHWLTSQCIFYVRIDNHSAEPFAAPAVSVVNTIGYSPLAAMILLIVIVITSLALVLMISCVRTKTPIPAANGCSLVISAACHGPPEDVQSWLKPLKWGVIDNMERDGLLHCGLTSGETGFFDRVEMKSKSKLISEIQSVAKFA